MREKRAGVAQGVVSIGTGERGRGTRRRGVSAYLECRRCDVDGVDAEECDGAIEALRARVESESEGKREAMRKMEEARDAGVREEDAEKARRRDERIKSGRRSARSVKTRRND